MSDFFQQLEDLHLPGKWNLVIHTGAEGIMTVSAIFQTSDAKDHAQKLVPPMVFRGTPQELDEAFFVQVGAPVQKASGLFNNMESYMKGLDEAKKQSKMEQDRKAQEIKAKAVAKAGAAKDGIEIKTTAAPDKEEKRRVYEEAMRKVSELNDLCKYLEALAALPSPDDYPEKKAELEKKKADLERKQEQYAKALQLFDQD